MRMSRRAGLFGGGVVHGLPITMGLPAIQRSSRATVNYTRILANNPANASGRITKIQVHVNVIGLTNVIVATFTQVTENTFTTRDYASVGDFTGTGLKEITVDLAVKEGDYIGLYYNGDTNGGASIEATGANGYWGMTGNFIPCTNLSFGDKLNTTAALSFGGTGIT